MKKTALFVVGGLSAVFLAGCAGMGGAGDSGNPYANAKFQKMLKNDFTPKGQATMARLDQTDIQAACSRANFEGKPLDEALSKKFEARQLAAVQYPADGQYLGDWKEGLKIAGNGKGMQWNDKPGTPNGGNCQACHEMVPNDPSQGNMGPSLVHYERLRGNSEAILKYTWSRIYDSEAYNPCSFMPPFGAHKILTEAQIKDVMALLMDPNSPVNK